MKMSGECEKCGQHALKCHCRCYRCKEEGVKLFSLTEIYHDKLVCKECAMEYHRQHDKFIEMFMNLERFRSDRE